MGGGSRFPLTDPCQNRAAPGGLDLASALRALADAGLSPEAFAAAVGALLRAVGAAQSFLGHANISTTGIYVSASAKGLAAAVEKIT